MTFLEFFDLSDFLDFLNFSFHPRTLELSDLQSFQNVLIPKLLDFFFFFFSVFNFQSFGLSDFLISVVSSFSIPEFPNFFFFFFASRISNFLIRERFVFSFFLSHLVFNFWSHRLPISKPLNLQSRGMSNNYYCCKVYAPLLPLSSELHILFIRYFPFSYLQAFRALFRELITRAFFPSYGLVWNERAYTVIIIRNLHWLTK